MDPRRPQSVLDLRLSEVRRTVPDAGGLVIATDQSTARAYAKQLKQITGEDVTVVLSDEAGASDRIDEFQESDRRWMVGAHGVRRRRRAAPGGGRLRDILGNPAVLRTGHRPFFV